MRQTLGMAVILGGLSLAGCAGGGYGYYATTPPPAVRVEQRGVAPGAGYVWMDGYWGYNGGRYALGRGALGSSSARTLQMGTGALGNASRPVPISPRPLAQIEPRPG
jgi:hypothetical protein